MPLAGHDDADVVGLPGIHIISTPMPLAGHDPTIQFSITDDDSDFYSHAPRGA